MTLRCVLSPLAAALLWAAAAHARADGATVYWSRPQVFVGEQVRFEVELSHPVSLDPRWSPPPFDGFLAERLPSEGGPMQRDAEGRSVRTTRFLRALFPARVGVLEVAPSTVVLVGRNGQQSEVAVPGASLRVDPLPEEARPPSFDGETVGQVRLRLTPLDERIALGGAARVRVVVFGTAHLGSVRELDLAQWLGSDVEVFREPPVLERTARDRELISRRSFTFALVPQRAGPLALPALEIPFFDPSRGIYRLARTEPSVVQVDPATEAEARPAVPASQPPAGGSPDDPTPIGERVLALTLGLVALVGLAWLWGRSRGRAADGSAPQARGPGSGDREPQRPAPTSTRVPAPSPAELRQRLDALDRSPDRPDLAVELRACLRAALHLRHGSPSEALSVADLEARATDPEAVALLRVLDHARFSPDAPGLGDPSARIAEVRRYLESALSEASRADAR